MSIHPLFASYSPGGHSLNPTLIWDYNIDHIDPQKAKRLFVTRIIQFGTIEDWMYGFDTFGGIDGFAQIAKDEVTDLSPKDLDFICLIFGFKKEETKCYKHKLSREKLLNF